MEGYVNFNTNFDPNALASQTSDVIQFVVIIDISGSVTTFKDIMNSAMRDVFMAELKNSHRAADIVIKAILFNTTVTHKSGFMPISNLQDDYLQIDRPSGGTALYQAVLEGFNHVEKYRDDLEDQGVNVRTNIFIVTDGEDNSSPYGSAAAVKAKVDALRVNESWASTFTINMLGVGNPSYFENACLEMGLDPTKCLSTVGATAKEIRQQMGVVSQSVSSSAASTAVSF